jgi:hypothetical protein
MGMLEMTCAIHPVTGIFLKSTERCETTYCRHCGGVIAIHKEGCSTTYQSEYSCSRCRGVGNSGSICKECAAAMHATGGICPGPHIAAIEEAVKKMDGHYLSRGRYRYRYRS